MLIGRSVLLIAFCLSLTACAGLGQSVGTRCVNVTYGPGLQDGSLQKPGDILSINWEARASNITSNVPVQLEPVQVVIKEQLIGPFSSADAVHQFDPTNTSLARGPVVASSPLIMVQQCTAKFYKSSLTIPSGLQPGYYDLYISAVTNSGGRTYVQARDIDIDVVK